MCLFFHFNLLENYKFYKEFPITKSKWNGILKQRFKKNCFESEASNNRYNFYLKFVL